MTLRIYVNGKVVPRSEAVVSVFDAGFQSGDAVWEGLRLYDGTIFRLKAHLERLESSARALRISLPLSREEMAEAVYETIRANDFSTDVHVRLIVTRGERSTSGMDPSTAPPQGSLFILAERKPVAEAPAPLRLATSPIRRPRPDVLDPAIHHANQLNSILARLSVRETGADAALMLDEEGWVAEADTANVFAALDGQVTTPPATACVPGITRACLLGLAAAHGMSATERPLRQYDLYRADEVFVAGTVGELTPVCAIDGIPIGDGSPGPVWRAMLQAYRNLVRSECGNLPKGTAGA